MNRRAFLNKTFRASVAVVAASSASGCKSLVASSSKSVSSDAAAELIREAFHVATEKYLYPSLLDRIYPGHFVVAPDGGYGMENTWPGLDGWQMAGAYLSLGKTRVALDYFDFVEASQRRDGNIPFAIFPGEQSPGSLDSWLRGLRYPEDVYTYVPRERAGRPPNVIYKPRKWIGLFKHWQVNVNPLSDLGALSHILTAREIFQQTRDREWLRQKLPSVTRAAKYVLARRSPNGLIAGAGFYVESPPRNQWDGITQCYAIWCFRLLAEMNGSIGQRQQAHEWRSRADVLERSFQELFWRENHYAEYVHPDRGCVDTHGLSDVNWAAIGLGIASRRQCRVLWPRLIGEPAFWRGDLPTHLVTKPSTYEKWEFQEPLPFPYAGYTHDVAAMGRVWYLESLACARIKAWDRLRTSVLKVAKRGQQDKWVWYERYHATPDGSVKGGGHGMYCEYPSILVRIVLKYRWLFPELKADYGNASR
jgi:hypothetical protein